MLHAAPQAYDARLHPQSMRTAGSSGHRHHRHHHQAAQPAPQPQEEGVSDPRVSGSGGGARRALIDQRYYIGTGNNSAYPGYAIARMVSTSTVCSGTWVTPYDILSAGHCVMNVATGVARFTSMPSWRTGEQSGFSPSQPWGSHVTGFVTWYRAEYNSSSFSSFGGVNYFDVSMFRIARGATAAAPFPFPNYLPIKYTCSDTYYTKARVCGFPQDMATANGNA